MRKRNLFGHHYDVLSVRRLNKFFETKILGKGYLVFIILFIICLLAFRNAFHLSLHGDDWQIISTYWGKLGPKYGFLSPRLYIANYGFSNITSILYKLFGNNSLYYNLLSLIFRTILAYGIYLFTKRFSTKTQSFIAALIFSLIAVGAQTTGWVFNMNAYIGIFFALMGVLLIIKLRDKSIWGLIICLVGYIIIPIRLYVLPPAIVLVELVKSYRDKQGLGQSIMYFTGRFFLISFLFLGLNILFPSIGFNATYKGMIIAGIKSLTSKIAAGDYLVFISIFTNLGQMFFPDLLFLPVKSDILKMISILFIGSLYLLAIGGVFGKKNVKGSILASLSIFFILLIVFRYFAQSEIDNNYFGWTYLGLVFFVGLILKFKEVVAMKKTSELNLYFILIIFIFSFLVPWLTEPGYLYATVFRYLILPAVGLSIFFGKYVFNLDTRINNFLYFSKVTLLILFVISQTTFLNNYLLRELKARPDWLNKYFSNSLRELIPTIPTDSRSVFYFEDFDNDIYDSLLRFGFGYHMHILYKLPYNEKNFPISFSNISEIRQYVDSNSIPEENIFALRWEENRLVDITRETRRNVKF